MLCTTDSHDGASGETIGLNFADHGSEHPKPTEHKEVQYLPKALTILRYKNYFIIGPGYVICMKIIHICFSVYVISYTK